MKISHLLFALAGFGLAAVNGRAAALDRTTECVQLPVYRVEIPRQSPAERAIARSLDELRATARTPITFKAEIPLTRPKGEAVSKVVKPAPLLVVARD